LADNLIIRRAVTTDAPAVEALLSEWLDWRPEFGRDRSIQGAITRKELLVAELESRIIGFIHFVLHEDIIDGGPNSFITAFYVSPQYRDKGVGTRLLRKAINDSLENGAVGVETSTIHRKAKILYEKNHFKQTRGDIAEAFLELDIQEHNREGRMDQSRKKRGRRS